MEVRLSAGAQRRQVKNTEEQVQEQVLDNRP